MWREKLKAKTRSLSRSLIYVRFCTQFKQNYSATEFVNISDTRNELKILESRDIIRSLPSYSLSLSFFFSFGRRSTSAGKAMAIVSFKLTFGVVSHPTRK